MPSEGSSNLPDFNDAKVHRAFQSLIWALQKEGKLKGYSDIYEIVGEAVKDEAREFARLKGIEDKKSSMNQKLKAGEWSKIFRSWQKTKQIYGRCGKVF